MYFLPSRFKILIIDDFSAFQARWFQPIDIMHIINVSSEFLKMSIRTTLLMSSHLSTTRLFSIKEHNISTMLFLNQSIIALIVTSASSISIIEHLINRYPHRNRISHHYPSYTLITLRTSHTPHIRIITEIIIEFIYCITNEHSL